MVPPGFFVLTFLALTAHASISVSDTIGHDLIKACREKSVATVATILRTHPAAAVFKSPQVCPVRQPGTPSLSAQCFSPPHWRQETITTAAPLSTADPRRPFAAEGAPLDVPCVFFVCAHHYWGQGNMFGSTFELRNFFPSGAPRRVWEKIRGGGKMYGGRVKK